MTEEPKKRGGARPGAGRPQGQEFSEKIQVRLSPDDKEEIRRRAEKAKLSMSEYLRRKGLE